jgi:hypothetical protein
VIAIFFIIRSARRYLSQTNSESVASQPFEASSECCTPMAIVTEATTEEESRI